MKIYTFTYSMLRVCRNSVFIRLPAEVGRGTKRSDKQRGGKRQPFIWMWG